MKVNKETAVYTEIVVNALVVDIYPKGKDKWLRMTCHKYRHSCYRGVFMINFQWCTDEESAFAKSISITSMQVASFCAGYLGLASHKPGEKVETLMLAKDCYISLNYPVPWAAILTPIGRMEFEKYEDGLALAHIMVQYFNKHLVE